MNKKLILSPHIDDEGIDTGPILYQKEFSLVGDLESIFNNIVLVGSEGIRSYLEGDCTAVPQSHEEATFFKRRTPEMSEIILEDFDNFTAEEIFNKVRCLQHPYPLPYIKCKGNTKLYLKEVRVNDDW
jgi:methionyl-tRNA formyltransferase|tara:strand:- start:6150 stop:6533 length:384 start_codon:yes stop_codon:yes gene_type:complete